MFGIVLSEQIDDLIAAGLLAPAARGAAIGALHAGAWRNRIALTWTVADVQGVVPLQSAQARLVLDWLLNKADPEVGVSWQVLRDAAHLLFWKELATIKECGQVLVPVDVEMYVREDVSQFIRLGVLCEPSASVTDAQVRAEFVDYTGQPVTRLLSWRPAPQEAADDV